MLDRLKAKVYQKHMKDHKKWITVVVIAAIVAVLWVLGSIFTPGALAQCKDEHFSYSKTRQGACSGHGGVEKWNR